MEFLIKLSTILEREIEFLKTEIFTKSRTFNKTLNNNTYKNNNDNKVGETWDFDNAFNISDCQSVCNADNSEDLLVKFSDACITSTTFQRGT